MKTFQKGIFSKRTISLIAGISLLIMAVAAGFSYGYVHNTLIHMDDPIATLFNLTNSAGLFKMELAGWLMIFLTDVLVAWALYIFLKEANKNLALLMAWLRLAYTVFLGVAIANLINVLNLVETKYSMNQEILIQLIMNHLNSFESLWSNGLIVFGFHLLLLGFLTYISGFVPKFWSILLSVAGISYIFIHGSKFVNLNYANQLDTIEMILGIPMSLAEIGLAIWLLIRGGKLNLKTTN